MAKVDAGIGSVRCIRIPRTLTSAAEAQLDDVAGRPVLIDLRLADEAQPRLIALVGSDVDVLLGAVVPPLDLLVHIARDGQRYLAVALAGRRGLKFRNTLFKIGDTIRSEIGCPCRHRGKQARSQNQREVGPTPYSPVHHVLLTLPVTPLSDA